MAVPRSWSSALTVGYHTSLCVHSYHEGEQNRTEGAVPAPQVAEPRPKFNLAHFSH